MLRKILWFNKLQKFNQIPREFDKMLKAILKWLF